MYLSKAHRWEVKKSMHRIEKRLFCDDYKINPQNSDGLK